MRRVACLVGVAALCLGAVNAEARQNYHRPLSLQDMVDAVGTNAEGMPEEELSKEIRTYALRIGDKEGVGVSARFADDPDGPIIVGWRTKGQLWRYEWVDETGLGRLEAFRPVGGHFAIETRHTDGRVVSVMLRSDLSVVGLVAGSVRDATLDATGNTLSVTIRSGEATTTVVCRDVKTRTGGYCR
jgi:hypothetical protein